MSWNGAGVFNRLFSWVADAAAHIDISSTRMDSDTNDIASNGFGNCLTRDGQGSATANLPMGGFHHTGVGNGVVSTDYITLGQVQNGISINWAQATGTADALTAAYTPAVTTLVDGQLFFVRSLFANATTTPTFSPNGLTAHTITKKGGAALAVGDIANPATNLILRYDLTSTRYDLLNPGGLGLLPLRQQFSVTGTYTPNPGMKFAVVEVVGSGGGGGGAAASATGLSSGGGGGGGGYARGIVTAAQIGASKAITIGAGGLAGATGNNGGGTGGTTSLDALVVVTGAVGGSGAAANSSGAGGAGGAGATGDEILTGSVGGIGISGSITTINGPSGYGGAPPLMGTTTPGVAPANAAAAGGTTGSVGSGGSGGQSHGSASTATGGAGGNGFITILELCSV